MSNSANVTITLSIRADGLWQATADRPDWIVATDSDPAAVLQAWIEEFASLAAEDDDVERRFLTDIARGGGSIAVRVGP